MAEKFDKFWKEYLPGIPTTIVSICAIIASSCTACSQIELTATYERLGTYAEPLVYRIAINEPQEGNEVYVGKRTEPIEGPSIDILPVMGGISKAYIVYYLNNKVEGVLNVDLPLDSAGLEQYNAFDLSWHISAYCVPSMGEATMSSGEKNEYGVLYVLVQDYQGNWSTSLIASTFNPSTETLTFEVYDRASLLVNSFEVLGSTNPFYSKLLADYSSFDSLVREKLG